MISLHPTASEGGALNAAYGEIKDLDLCAAGGLKASL